MNYFLEKLANDQVIAKMDSKIFCYIHLARMTRMQYADDLDAESRKVAEFHDKATVNDIFIKGVDYSIYCRLQKF